MIETPEWAGAGVRCGFCASSEGTEGALRMAAELTGARGRLVQCKQVHGLTVMEIDSESCIGEMAEADALISCKAGIGLVIRTADCVPVLLWDEERHAIGAVHSGWRGTEGDIVGLTVEAMERRYGCRAGEMHAAIGPHIQVRDYEVGGEVAKKFPPEYVWESNNGREHLDLTGMVRSQLIARGMEASKITVSMVSTASAAGWPSWRRDKTAERIVSVIMLEGSGEQTD